MISMFTWIARGLRGMLDNTCRTPDEIWAGAASLPGEAMAKPGPIRSALPLRETDPLKPALDVHRVAYRGDANLIQLDIRIVRSVKRTA